jgi:NAD-reducing hydrogenase large subunit
VVLYEVPLLQALRLPDGVYRIGPLAKLSVAAYCDTPLANAELKEFKELGRNDVVQSTFLYHYARLVEVLFCIETAKKLLEDPGILSDRVSSKAKSLSTPNPNRTHRQEKNRACPKTTPTPTLA